MAVTVTFLGAAGTVTGSKYLVQGEQTCILIDVGMFQGSREWRERNWQDPPCDLSKVSATLFTHAHIDHTGLYPRYFTLGLTCPVFATKATVELCRLMLLDSAGLQEEEAEYRRKTGKSRHHPPLPLYTREDAKLCLENLRSVSFESRIEVAAGVFATWHPMGHIIGAASIALEIEGKRIVFSGDIGRYTVPILRDPVAVELGDLTLIESTYGNRDHGDASPKARLGEIIREATKRKGITLIPSFAVGRAQNLLYYIRELKEEGAIPDIPVILDSPMATEATEIYRSNPSDYDAVARALFQDGGRPFSPSKVHFIRDQQESKKLNSIVEPMILISASGMLSGGRILHHLVHRISSPNNTLVFVGYQPTGGRGDWILSGAKSLRLFGEERPIRAKIENISGLSAHAGRSELLRWCKECRGTPKKVAIVHGEPDSASDFAKSLREQLHWDTFVASYMQTYTVE